MLLFVKERVGMCLCMQTFWKDVACGELERKGDCAFSLLIPFEFHLI